MLRGLTTVVLTTSMLVTLVVPASPADEEEPKVRGKTAAQWQEVLQKDAKVEHRQGAVIALSLLGPKVRGVVPAVCVGLKDADSSVRLSAAQTLGQMGAEAKAALEPLIKTLKSQKDAAVRQAAATALGRFGPAARPALDSLNEALKDKQAGMRGAAAEALGRIGPDAWTSLPN